MSFVRGGVLPEAAKLVPPKTVLLVNVNDFGQVRKQFDKTSLYGLYKDPSMSALVNDIKSKVRTKIAKANAAVAEALFDAKLLPQGRVSVALVMDEQAKAGQGPSVLVMAQWGDSAVKIKEAADKMVKKAVEGGYHRKSEDYRGVTIATIIKESKPREVPDYSNYTPGGNSKPPMKTVQPPPQEIHYCFVDDCLFGSDRIDVLKFAVAHIQGATSSALAEDSSYSTTLKAVGPYHDIDIYVNIKGIIATMTGGDTTGRAKMMSSSLGLDNVVSFGFAGAVSRVSGTSLSGKGLLRIDGEKKGLFKALEFESSAVKIPRFVPESSYGVASINLNIKKTFEELVKVLSGFAPQVAAIMYMPLVPPGPNGEQGVLLKDDVIDHLGSQIVIANSISKPIKAGAKPESYFAIALNDRQALERSLSVVHDKLLAHGNPEMRRELLGQTIYLMNAPSFGPFFPQRGKRPMLEASATGNSGSPRIAFTVTNDYLVFGTESSVERAIRSSNSKDAAVKSVDSAEWFGRAKAAMPSAVGWASMEDSEVSAELSWQMMKQRVSDKDGDNSVSVGVGGSSSFGLWAIPGVSGGLFNFGLLPKFDSVRKHFGVSAAYGLSRADGIFFEFKYLDPK